MSSNGITLSLSEKLHFVGAVLHTALLAVIAGVGQLFLSSRHPEYTGVARRMFTAVMKGLTVVPVREKAVFMPLPLTPSAITSWCANHKVPHTITPLPHSAALHWIGPRSSSKSGNLLIYVHGGGYNNPMLAPGHVAFAIRCAANASASLVMLEYTLSPGARFPTQLKQAVAALQYVLGETPPSKITLAGESAGSHLIAGLFSHILHPVQGVDNISLDGRFAGVCFICPFLSYDLNKPSFTENAARDYVTVEGIQQLIADFTPSHMSVADAIKEPQISPAEAPPGWWRGIPVERILIVYGAWEVLKDDAVLLGKHLEWDAGKETKINVVQCAREVHAACIIDQMLGLKSRQGDSRETILAWMSAAEVDA